MRIFLWIFFVILLGYTRVNAQSSCPYFDAIMNQAKTDWKNGDFESALNQLAAAREHCPNLGDVIDKQLLMFTNEISAKYIDANAQRDSAEIERNKSETARIAADSSASLAIRIALKSYSNDLAANSAVVLKAGNRTLAYKIAEFAYKYVDKNNERVLKSYINAKYYDNSKTNPIPWTSNLIGHTDLISKVAFSPDGSKIATSSYDKSIKVWDVKRSTEIHTLKGHDDLVLSLEFSPNGSQLISFSYDSNLILWDLETGNQLKTINFDIYPTCSAFSPNGKLLAISTDDAQVQIWDFETMVQLGSSIIYESSIYDLEFSPDSKVLAISSEEVQFLDLESKVITKIFGGIKEKNTEKNIVRKGAENSESQRFLYATSIEFSDSGKYFSYALSNGDLVIIDNISNQNIDTLKGNNSIINSIAFFPNENQIATASNDKTIKIWQLGVKNELVNTLYGHESPINSIDISQDGKKLVSGSDDKSALIFDLDIKNEVKSLTYNEENSTIAISPDGKKVARGFYDGMVVISDLEGNDNSNNDTLIGGYESANVINFSNDNSKIVVGYSTGQISMWEIDSLDSKERKSLQMFQSEVEDAIFSTDDKSIISKSSDSIGKWNYNSVGRIDTTLITTPTLIYDFSYNSNYNKVATFDENYYLQIWDFTTKNVLDSLGKKKVQVSSVTFSPDGNFLATTNNDQSILIWDFEKRVEFSTLCCHSDIIIGFAFSNDQRYLASFSYDNSIKIWDWKLGKEVIMLNGNFNDFISDTYLNKAIFLGEGEKIAIIAENNSIGIWSFIPELKAPLDSENNKLYKLTFSQLKEFGFEELLYQHSNNDSILIASGDADQIAEFALLMKEKPLGGRGLEQKIKDYELSEKLFLAAYEIDKEHFNYDQLGALYGLWAESLFTLGKPEEAKPYIDLMYKNSIDKFQPIELYYIYAKKTSQKFDFLDFKDASDTVYLNKFINYFNQKSAYSKTYAQRIPDILIALEFGEKLLLLDSTDTIKKRLSQDYNSLGFYYLFASDGKNSELSLKRSIELDSENLFPYTNLPPAYLLLGKIEEAEKEYKRWKNKPFGLLEFDTFKDAFLDDLEKFEEAGLKGINFELARKWLHEND